MPTEPIAPGARDRRIQHARQLAHDAFAQHQLEQPLNVGLYRSWICSRPSSGCYAFTISTTPGRLIVCGDIGELIVQRMPDMIPWCRSSIKDISYFAEKVPAAIPTREYDPLVAGEWLKEEIAEAKREGHEETLTLLRELKDDYDPEDGEAEHVFKMAVYESGVVDGGDFPDFSNWNHNFLWCREAVKWLIGKLDADAKLDDLQRKAVVNA